MRIFRRQEFMKLPKGVIYAKGKPWFFGELCVKGETLTCDFICRQLVGIDAPSSAQLDYRLEAMLQQGVSYPVEQDYGRDGCFDDEEFFLVYELEDLKELAELFTTAATIPLEPTARKEESQ